MNRGVAAYRQYPEWIKGPSKVENGHVVLDPARSETYYMYEPTNLVFDLLDVYRDNLDASSVTRFVRRYGLLFHGSPNISAGPFKEPLSKWREDLEQLDLIARLYMDLKESEENGPTELMLKSFRAIRANFDVPEGQETSDKDLLGAVSVLFAEMVTNGMQGTSARLASTCWLDITPKSPTTFLLLQVPKNLVTAAYSQFAHLVASKAPIVPCPGCGRLFVPESEKQKYHSKSCASTSRWRRWKAAQPE
jgi:hypothetical protein